MLEIKHRLKEKLRSKGVVLIMKVKRQLAKRRLRTLHLENGTHQLTVVKDLNFEPH